jgi:hypothetical protein
MVLITGDGADEGKIVPDEEMFAKMGAYNEELVKAGIMLDGQGLQPTANGRKVVFEAGDTAVVDGPFTESKEVLAGYWLWQVSSIDEAVEWAKRCPSDPKYGTSQVLEIRPLYEVEDFGDAYTEEQKAADEKLQAEVERQHGAG